MYRNNTEDRILFASGWIMHGFISREAEKRERPAGRSLSVYLMVLSLQAKRLSMSSLVMMENTFLPSGV